MFVLTERAGAAGIRHRLDGVTVVTHVVGKIEALRHRSGHDKGGEEQSANGCTSKTRSRSACIGTSTGHPNITVGTIGARVTNGTDVYALSNNHVYADENRASIGDNVYSRVPSMAEAAATTWAHYLIPSL